MNPDPKLEQELEQIVQVPNPIIDGTSDAVRKMFATALNAASTDIEKLFETNSNVPMSGVLRALTTGMIQLLEQRVQAVAAPKSDKKNPG